MVGNWFIMNEDSGRKGEMWVIYEDWIVMHAKDGGANAQHYSHQLDAGKNPKQIDIAATSGNGPTPFKIMKGIYVLDGDELRLCLGGVNQDRPVAFPEKPKPGEVLILQRQAPDGSKPKAKEQPPAKSDQERMMGVWVIVNEDSGRKGEQWWIGADTIGRNPHLSGFMIVRYFYRLDATKSPKQIDITVKKMNNEYVGVMKGIYTLDDSELRLCLGEIGKDRPAAFPEKPKPGEVLILHRKTPDGAKPKAKENQPDQKPLAQKVLTPEEAIKLRSTEKVTVQFKVAAVEDKTPPLGEGLGIPIMLLKDGGSFAVTLPPSILETIARLGIDPVKHFTGKVVRVTGVIHPAGGSFYIVVNDLNQAQFTFVGE
jgi:uncharacterized protein (TIGR03067 family)